MAGASNHYRHVLVVPGIQEGHVNGMLRFAALLASAHHQQGLLVSFSYPARAHALALKRNKLSALPPSLRVHIVEDGLPTAEHEFPTTSQVQGSVAIMQNAIEAVLQQYAALASKVCGGNECEDGVNEDGFSPASEMHSSSWPPICCIISDIVLPGAQDLAAKFEIPRVNFWTGNGTTYYMISHLPQIIAKGMLPLLEGSGDKWKLEAPLIDFIPGLPAFHLTELPRDLLQISDVSHSRYQFVLKAVARAKDADRILVHSVYGLESTVYDAMQAQGFPIYPVGPLFESNPLDSGTNDQTEGIEWLNQQKPASVVYVALGTIAKLNLQEMLSMALGLEASGHPFFWVVRMDSLPAPNLHESLPDGFLERTVSKGKGIIVTWASQVEVLKHIAVGAFFSHCGWNSVLESLWEGIPMVACPRAAEQRCNARFVVKDWKVGVEMEREDDGSFTTVAAQKAIEEVMGNQEVKERALHFKQVVRHAVGTHGTSHSNILRDLCKVDLLGTSVGDGDFGPHPFRLYGSLSIVLLG
ncbi:hypothetical protein GOP47_0007640 [Adiantum capillus-veneris]|uniref:Glycosyltransferase n=1 Tax=Adiantum capillus-veneris TaxID=13818 RepID=A0A9D4ZLQ4_ADICA|nr:hypothetical protein GOP47_0007640 [Adiantum capillus-veneris]